MFSELAVTNGRTDIVLHKKKLSCEIVNYIIFIQYKQTKKSGCNEKRRPLTNKTLQKQIQLIIICQVTNSIIKSRSAKNNPKFFSNVKKVPRNFLAVTCRCRWHLHRQVNPRRIALNAQLTTKGRKDPGVIKLAHWIAGFTMELIFVKI